MSELIEAGVNPNWFSKWITTEGPFHVKIGAADAKKDYQEELKQFIQARQVQPRRQEIVQTPVNLTQEQLAYLRNLRLGQSVCWSGLAGR
jgi:hypothetical protein